MSRTSSKRLDPALADGQVVVCHLGSGASGMCALLAGRSVDSTMSFTAVDGLPHGHAHRPARPGRGALSDAEPRLRRAADRELPLQGRRPEGPLGPQQRRA
ncbi:MAG: hypothetical protein U1E17_08070 [Geminicoccaceae bacterium]